MTLNERLSLSHATRTKGYNCAQSVMVAFPDIFQLPEHVCLRMGAAIGGGLGLTGSTCGVLVALALAEGMRTTGNPTDKSSAYRSYHSLSDAFKAEHGHTLCPQLKAAGCNCNELINSGIALYSKYIDEE